MANTEQKFGKDEYEQLQDYASKQKVLIGLEVGIREFLKLWLKNPSRNLTDRMLEFAEFYHKTYRDVQGTNVLTVDDKIRKYLESDAFKKMAMTKHIEPNTESLTDKIDEVLNSDEYNNLPENNSTSKENPQPKPEPIKELTLDNDPNILE